MMQAGGSNQGQGITLPSWAAAHKGKFDGRVASGNSSARHPPPPPRGKSESSQQGAPWWFGGASRGSGSLHHRLPRQKMLNVRSCKSYCSVARPAASSARGKRRHFFGVNGCEQWLLKVSSDTALIMWDAVENWREKTEAFFFRGVGFHYLLVPGRLALSRSFISCLAFRVTFKVK